MVSKETFYIIDGSSYCYRAFHAIRDLATSKGFPTNAVFGFAQMLLKMVKEKKPDYLAVAFDTSAPTFRHESFADYKAQRPKMPDALSVQIPYIHRLVEAFNTPVVMEDGYEADDLIGTLARKGESAGLSVVIVSGDKDMLQLVSSSVSVYDSMRNKVSTEKEVEERFGVEPARVVEVMGLMGDAIDNIPGVPGIGPKTARELIQKFGTIESLLEHLDEVKRKNVREALFQHADMAKLSRKLATIQTDSPIDFVPDRFRNIAPNSDAVVALCQELELTSLLKQITPELPKMEEGFALPDTVEKLDRWLTDQDKIGMIAIELISSLEDPMQGTLSGIAMATASDRVVFLPGNNSGLLQQLRHLLEDEKVKKIGHDLKRAWLALRSLGIRLRGIYLDTEVAAYLLNPGRNDGRLEASTLECLGKRLVGVNELVLGLTGNKKGDLTLLAPEQLAPWACERASVLFPLEERLRAGLLEHGLKDLFDQIELPLIEILGEMERVGFKLDPVFLEGMSKEVEGKLKEGSEQIFRLAKGEFNIHSPKQLAEVLFERLGLPPVRKTKTGYSTDEEVLIQLALQHPLPSEILSYRQLMKLKSTYIDALPRLLNPKTGRLHTRFKQTVTATGRLSSREPNLQNIPVRGEIGRRIRQAFVAQEGYVLLSVDYNQIELRILAHLSQDPHLLESFMANEDIHTRTACEIFGLAPDAISTEMRRMAKTVNFGILYGISPFGLASSMGVSQMEAKRYIDRYFSTYGGVKRFIEETLEKARERGYVMTLFHRRRYIPELKSPNATLRAQGERLAVNTPIQGSAADLIKIGMIRIDRRFKQEPLGIRLLLQVHDELIFEVPKEVIEPAKEQVQAEMEGVATLLVPLSVGIKVGRTWGELE